MSPRVPAAVAALLLAAVPAFAQDWYEPNPSLARLSSDDAYARESAKSLRTAGIAAAVAMRLDAAGRVVVVDASGRIARLASDGRLDPTFGADGVAETPVFGGGLSGVEIDSVGRIVVTDTFYELVSHGPGGPTYGGQLYGAARLLADGSSLDPAFSGDGLLELDNSNGLFGLGAVRASGSDGAMLAVAGKIGRNYDSAGGLDLVVLAGLVRISAEGTIDATYGGGFAQVAQVSLLDDAVYAVPDFAVDSSGRAVVVVQRDSGQRTVLRLDAAGGPDPTFFGYTSHSPDSVVWDSFAASRIALDGAGRIVGLDDTHFLRRLTDGAPDPAFSGDGFAWNQAAHIAGLTSVQLAQLCATERLDPDHAVESVCPGELLAVATDADRWALARPVDLRNAKGRVVGRGIEVRAIDPADPGAIVSTTYRSPDGSDVRALAITPDGTTAYALGATFVLRVDLTSPKPLPLPDLRAHWIGNVRAIDLGGGRYRVTARVRIRNASRHDAESAVGFVGFGDGKFDVPLVSLPGVINSIPFRVRARSSVVKRFTWEGGDTTTNLSGARLAIQVSCELPDGNFADNTATSLPITPVYAPR